MFPVRDGSCPTLSPPARFTRVPCPPGHFTRLLSHFFLLPPLRPFLCGRRSTSSSGWASVVRPSEDSFTTLRLAADQNAPLLVSCLASCMQVCTPSPTCAAGGTWLGFGWRGKGDGAPCDGLESLDASAGVAQESMPSSMLEFTLRF